MIIPPGSCFAVYASVCWRQQGLMCLFVWKGTRRKRFVFNVGKSWCGQCVLCCLWINIKSRLGGEKRPLIPWIFARLQSVWSPQYFHSLAGKKSTMLTTKNHFLFPQSLFFSEAVHRPINLHQLKSLQTTSKLAPKLRGECQPELHSVTFFKISSMYCKIENMKFVLQKSQ